jgi:hypothetical protein
MNLSLLSSRSLLLSFTLISLCACTLLLNRSADQCSANSDCQSLKANSVCSAGICIVPGNESDGGPPDGSSRFDAAFGIDGCFAGIPTNGEQLLNACTTAQCLPFDNCARLGICDGSAPEATFGPDGGSSAAASDAGSPAAVMCSDPAARPNTIYMTGSTNFEPFLKALAPLLAKSATPYTIVWQVSNSCSGVGSVFNPDATKRLIKEGPGKLTVYYDNAGEKIPCLLDPSGNTIDVGESDIFASSCAAKLGYTPDFSGIGEYFGPIQAMVFAVPATSSQRAISAAAARYAFGRGGTEPWTDPNQLFNRNDGTGTNQIMSRAMDVPPSKWWGVDKRSAKNMADQLKAVPAASTEKTLGVLSADFADQERGNITELAFQAPRQTCAFWPDSTPFARDKQNIRDGHYPIWGALHFFTRLEQGTPTAAAAAFVLRFSVAKLEEGLLKAIIDTNNVPACAMRVSRDGEMGELSPSAPAFSCECYYDAQTSSSSCPKCATSAECPSDRPACNYGFCEKR